MAVISFKAKPWTGSAIENGKVLRDQKLVTVPEIKTSHCDMTAFRTHAKYGAYANSTLFLPMLKRDLLALGIKSPLNLEKLPESVIADTRGFLAVITVTL